MFGDKYVVVDDDYVGDFNVEDLFFWW